ncbi:MAG: type II toxin-antitoxin system VapC family toxin [Gammaproteobacteria bacterium]|nr:type II toxin-antitoxin system VapC family toxin [Gammaproteobacteria bacterium]
MSGTNGYLLDTNVVIGLLKGSTESLALLNTFPDLLEQCTISQISRMELLGYPGIGEEEKRQIEAFINGCQVAMLDESIETIVISLRRKEKIKLPDAIIIATALSLELELISHDMNMQTIYTRYP